MSAVPQASARVAAGGWFCDNERCVLHVRAGDPGVRGSGEWAVRPDGVVTSRRLAGGRIVCDVCAGVAQAGDKPEEEP